MAQLGGIPIRVKLTCDLTRYDRRLTEGQEGMTIPSYKCSEWGSMESFVAVRFDCGATLDILWKSLEILDKEYLKEQEERKRKRWEEYKTAKNIVEHRGPQGGFRDLSFDYISFEYNPEGHSSSRCVGFKEESEELIEYFKTLGKKILYETAGRKS